MVRRMLRKPAVLEATGWPNSTLYWNIKNGRFPKGVKIGARSVAWFEDEVLDWQQKARNAA
jgi:prophage regulatory protein